MFFSGSAERFVAAAFRVIWIVVLCVALGVIFWLNALQPSFVYRDMSELYSDGHYMASVAKNIAEGHGVSYWNGISYRFLDPEISTGPVVFFPMAAALWVGAEEIIVFSASPIIINLILLALLLSKVSKLIPSLRVFVTLSAAVCVASLCFQRWQWYLPLGEVPAALLLLLATLSISDAVKRNRLLDYGCAGAVLGLAILSKMAVILVLPVFIAAVFFNKRNFPSSVAISFAIIGGVLLDFFVYAVICVALSPGVGVGELLSGAYGYFSFNFNFGIVDGIFPQYGDKESFPNKILFYTKENFIRGASVYDPIGYMKLALVYSSIFLMGAVGLSLPRDKKVLVFSAMASAIILCMWYFSTNLHNARYLFVVGYTGLFFLCVFTALTNVEKNRKALIIGVGALSFALFGRNMVFSQVTSFSVRSDAKNISDFLNNADISDVLGSLTLVNGFPKIAYYLDGDIRYLRPIGYLRRHAEFDKSFLDCDVNLSVLYVLASPLNDSLMYCLIKKDKVAIPFRWKDNEPGYFLKKIEKWESGIYRPECGFVVYQNARYMLMQCSKKELAKVIERQTEGRFFMSQ